MATTSNLPFLRRHPLLCLLLLTPRIPEYLSSSSPLNAILLNPGTFVFELGANLGLYGAGALLVREAAIRWRKGWATVLLLGGAYGILEEGVALSTLFNPNASPVGDLGFYGHWLGVNWVWAAGIVPFHALYSISLPILLLGIGLPSTRGEPFLGGRKLAATMGILALDVVALAMLVVFGEKFWMGGPVFVGSLVAIGVLVVSARRVGEGALRAGTGVPRPARRMAFVGLLFFPSVLLVQRIPEGLGLPAAVDFALTVLLQGAFLAYVLRSVGPGDTRRQLVAFAFGLVIPIAALGLLVAITLPVILAADLAMVLFFRRLWQTSGT